MALYLLHQSASGYALFSAHAQNSTEAVRNCISDLNRFTDLVQLTAFHPFESALDAFNQTNSFWEGIITGELNSFLELNLPQVEESNKKPNFTLGIAEPKIVRQIRKTTNIPCQFNEFVLELLCGVRMHFDDLITKDLNLKPTTGELDCNLQVIQSILLLDTLDKDINCLSMKVRHWYSLHFPELAKIIVNDNYLYVRVAKKLVEDKSILCTEDNDSNCIPVALIQILGDEDKAKQVVEAGKKASVIGIIQGFNVQQFCQRVMEISEDRVKQHDYLVNKMNEIAPNLVSLIGEVFAARLIARAGSLRNLATWPSSTLQVALFKALKTGPNTSGKIHLSIQMGRSPANKCSLAARKDFFADKKSIATSSSSEKTERLDFKDKAAMRTRQGGKRKCEDVEVENGNGMDAEKNEVEGEQDAIEKKKKYKKAVAEPEARAGKGKKNKKKRKKKNKAVVVVAEAKATEDVFSILNLSSMSLS